MTCYVCGTALGRNELDETQVRVWIIVDDF